MENEKSLSHTQSLNIIEQMISAARNDHRENGDGWLIWGWLLFAASAASAVLVYFKKFGYIGYVWTGMLVVGFVLYFAWRMGNKKSKEVKTYMQELFQKFNTGFFISLFVLIAASWISGSVFAFGYYYILYAFWMFMHGSAIRFKPLIIGAVVNWLAAIAIFLIHDLFYVMLISAIAVLIGYLIPGYMLRYQYNKKTKSISL